MAVGTAAQVFIPLVLNPLDFYGSFFKSAPKTPSYLKNMSGFHCTLLCMVPDLKANSLLLLLALTYLLDSSRLAFLPKRKNYE